MNHFDTDLHIQQAREVRSAYLASLFAAVVARIQSAFHIKSHTLANSH
ncbi:RSP_7527 family protein [Parathalassolituus penaei]|uniref:Uncharacterized protein n=1 Tax=Parathalassolituus penaei TaxID=2997323 RepID=A0A9X3ITG7_9GAMM|nr:hypothetical protein [Parathalassolituus penaei]MCY0965874.1 hypothetical protein [Parathalassolituus penaei]